jgi:uncharacterized membrane protein
MRNKKFTWYKNAGFIIWCSIFVIALGVAIVTYNPSNVIQGSLLWYAVQYHLTIMLVTILIALVFGFVWSSLIFRELEEKKTLSKGFLDVIFQFLDRDEREAIDFLLKKGGVAVQADLSRALGSRLRAHRAAKELEGKKLIDVVAYGKVRELRLKENVIDLLKEG